MNSEKTFNLVYEELVFEHNLNLLVEEVNDYVGSVVITEENFFDVCKTIWEKVKNFFSMSVQVFKERNGEDS